LLASITDLGFRAVDQTEKETHMENDGKTPYDLQDILFAMP
jgi:hypothetical protein